MPKSKIGQKAAWKHLKRVPTIEQHACADACLFMVVVQQTFAVAVETLNVAFELTLNGESVAYLYRATIV